MFSYPKCLDFFYYSVLFAPKINAEMISNKWLKVPPYNSTLFTEARKKNIFSMKSIGHTNRAKYFRAKLDGFVMGQNKNLSEMFLKNGYTRD